MKLLILLLLTQAFAQETFHLQALQGRNGRLSFQVNEEHTDAGECRINIFADSIQIQSANPIAISHFQSGHLNSYYLNLNPTRTRQAILSASKLPDGALELCGIYGRARNIHRYLQVDSRVVEMRLSFNCGALGLGEEIRLTSRCEF